MYTMLALDEVKIEDSEKISSIIQVMTILKQDIVEIQKVQHNILLK